MIPILMMSSYVTAKASNKKCQPIDKSNPIDERITYKDGERIVTPVESK